MAVAPLFEGLSMHGPVRSFSARLCLDWSEREYHVAGELGSTVVKGMLDLRWLLRGGGRSLTLTANGKRQLSSLGVSD